MAGAIRACKQAFAMARFFSSYEGLFPALDIAGRVAGMASASFVFTGQSRS